MTSQSTTSSQAPLVDSTTGDANPANPSQQKRDIACAPATVGDFFQNFFVGYFLFLFFFFFFQKINFNRMSRKIMSVRAEYKLAFYMVLVFMGSLFSELSTPKKLIFLQRIARPLNTFVIRFGFGWVMTLLIPLVIVTTRIYSKNSNVTILGNLFRLIINGFVWFVATSVFVWYYASQGMCLVVEQTNQTHTAVKNLLFNECKRQGHHWTGFDISGHTFLLIFCNLILIEEIKVTRIIDRIALQTVPSVTTESDFQLNQAMSKKDRLIIQIIVCLVGLTAISYDYVLLITVFYYHTVLEKMLALLTASICWYLCYRVLYPKISMSPGTGASNGTA